MWQSVAHTDFEKQVRVFHVLVYFFVRLAVVRNMLFINSSLSSTRKQTIMEDTFRLGLGTKGVKFDFKF